MLSGKDLRRLFGAPTVMPEPVGLTHTITRHPRVLPNAKLQQARNILGRQRLTLIKSRILIFTPALIGRENELLGRSNVPVGTRVPR